MEALRQQRGLLHRAGDLDDHAAVHRDGAEGRRDADAHLHRRADDRAAGKSPKPPRWSRTRSASPPRRWSSAPPSRSEMGVKDLILTPSHAMLTIHEIVAHATELDRILGYEANYAGTSFVKLTDVGKLEIRLEAVQRHRRPHRCPAASRTIGLRRRRREDAAVAARARRASWSACRPTARPAHSSARRRAAAARPPTRGATTRSCGCRTCTSSRARRDRRRRRDHRRHEGRRADRRPRQLLDRPAALQRPVRRQRVLGDQERQEARAW